MSNWEYKIISSGKGGFASPALMEKFLNDLGQDNWEIISFNQPSDNALAFQGLARRSAERDWTLEDAVKAAARTEADKLRAEFEAKFKAGSGQAAPEEEGETFLADEIPGTEGSIRRLRDTSRDDDLEAPEEENGAAPKDEWDKLSSEDELPAFFDALRPHMRRNQRGPGMSVGLDYLAKKWQLDESDIKGALVECGLQIPADENSKPVFAEYEGELYWVNINRRGEIWINLRDKPQPVFRVVQAKRVEAAEEPVAAEASANVGACLPRDESGHDGGHRPPLQQNQRPEGQSEQRAPSGPKTFLDKIRGMMRRNRRGHGMSGSFQYLTKALKLDDAQLFGQLAEHGLTLAEGQPPVEATEGDFVYWLNKNNRGEIWINAELARESKQPEAVGLGLSPTSELETSGVKPDLQKHTLPPENTLTAVRLLMQPKKKGEGVTALLSELAGKLEKSPDVLQAALAAAGLHLPDSPKAKPTFAEHGGEIYWLNVNAKGHVWINAKQSAATKKSRAKKSEA